MKVRVTAAAGIAVIAVSACGGDGDVEPVPEPLEPVAEATVEAAAVEQLELHVLDCGQIDISDLDVFSTEGDYAGVADSFANTCWLVRHPQGDLLWDLGLPGLLAESEPLENGIFTVSLERTLTDQLAERGIAMSDIEQVSISHSHFDHIGQVDQVDGSTWLVHSAERAFMFPDDGESPPDNAAQFAPFADLDLREFTGTLDVFGDGSVIIHETPGHTPGHTSLQVNLPETGPVFLTGDLYHRTESRELRRVPQFNTDVEAGDPTGGETLASMDVFETTAAAVGGRVIIQHERDDVESLPPIMR